MLKALSRVMNEIWLIIKASLYIALWATFFVMVFSTFLALALVRFRSTWLRALELLIYVPMAMPPVALGYGLLQLFGPKTPFGLFLSKALHIEVAFNPLGAIIAAFMVSFGIGLRAMRVAFESIDPLHGQRAALMGANKAQIFFHITFPLALPSLIGASILVFIRSLGEFGATMVLAGNTLGSTRTLALAIWTDMQSPDQGYQCLALVALSALISLVALIFSELLLRRSFR